MDTALLGGFDMAPRDVKDMEKPLIDGLNGMYSDWIYDAWREQEIAPFLTNLPDDRLLEIAMDLGTSKYYPILIHQSVVMNQAAKAQQAYSQKATELVVPPDSAEAGKTIEDYIKESVIDANRIQYRLKMILQGIRTLRDNIKLAVEHGDLEKPCLERLKIKMEALQEFYPEACSELGEEPQKLVDLNAESWWYV
jgi:hypothetical protein